MELGTMYVPLRCVKKEEESEEEGERKEIGRNVQCVGKVAQREHTERGSTEHSREQHTGLRTQGSDSTEHIEGLGCANPAEGLLFLLY